MKKKPRFSLSLRFSLIFTLIVIVIIAGIAGANQILLGKIYDREKRRTLTEAYETINKVFTEDMGADSLELEKIYSTKNITVFLMDDHGNELFSSSANADDMPFGGPWGPGEPAPGGPHDGEPRDFRPRDRGERRVTNEISEKLNYNEYIIDEIRDNRLGASFIQLTARLYNGYILYMRTPVAAMDDAARTANLLLIYIGIVAVIISLIIIFLVSGAVTKPIRELTQIAADMSELKFSRRYNSNRNDEIGDLGSSVNLMSSRLEDAITSLKASNAQLEKDIELKNSIDRARKEFIANASHELKTPLALISGYAEGMRNNIASSEEDRAFYYEVIVDEAGRMDKIIKQMLAMTELDFADILEKHELDLVALVRDVVRSRGILAGQRGADIELSCPESLIVNGDEWLLGQAVSNYLTNAVNHVDSNGIIKVSLGESENMVRLSVYNSGAPIPDESAEHIWESFYKLDKARTRAYGGSGLGLAIVKRSIELHGGSCGFTNRETGVEFFFEIPIKD